MEKAGRFPKSTYISPNRRVWFGDEIIAWQNAVDEFDPNRRRAKVAPVLNKAGGRCPLYCAYQTQLGHRGMSEMGQ
jgi:hypothetical protein